MALSTIVLAAMLAAGCASVGPASLQTRVQYTWTDPKYAAPPLSKVFVISMMEVEPGGREHVEDAIVARLASAGVAGVASHTVLSQDPQQPGQSLSAAIAASGAGGVLLVEVRAVGAYEPYTVGETITSISPDTMASYRYLQRQNVYQTGDYKVAQIQSALYQPSMGKQVWTLYTNSYDASDLARNLPDFTFKLVGAMHKDRIIAAAPKPAS
ncbi:MAG: hypothetical protein IT521_10730 [Burkholderiales bacterium]|nr:hypothetical protein [Burkholderiales bacterium]